MLSFPNYYISTPIMSEKKNFISNHNNKRKMRWPPTLFTGGGRHGGGGRGGGGDELATVKAAAWAWYQRNEGKPMMIREFDLSTRATRTHQPSRYKLEASKNMILSENKVSKSPSNNFLRGDQETKFSSLLDPYEIKSISKRIDEGSLAANRASVFRQKKLEYDSKKENRFVRKVNMRNLWKGLILMAPRTVCGRSDDVDVGAYRSGPRTVKFAQTNRR